MLIAIFKYCSIRICVAYILVRICYVLIYKLSTFNSCGKQLNVNKINNIIG